MFIREYREFICIEIKYQASPISNFLAHYAKMEILFERCFLISLLIADWFFIEEKTGKQLMQLKCNHYNAVVMLVLHHTRTCVPDAGIKDRDK